MPNREARRAARRAEFQRFLAESQAQSAAPEIAGWEPPVAEPESSSGFAPAAIRGLGMLIGVTPGVGALAGGGSELLAQSVEKRFSPAEIAAAAGSGLIGGAAVRSLAKNIASPLISAIKGAGWGAAQPVVRGALDPEYETTPQDIALSSVVGGGIAGGFSKLAKFLQGPPKAATTGPLYEVVPTAQAGGSVLGGGKVTTKRGGKTTLTGAEMMPVKAPSAITEASQSRWTPPTNIDAPTPSNIAFPTPDPLATVLSPIGSSAEDLAPRIAQLRDMSTMGGSSGRSAAAELDELLELQKIRGIEERRAGAGVVAQPSTYAETLSATTPEGLRATEATKYLDEETNALAELSQALGLTAKQANNIPPKGKARELYIALREAGMPHASALNRVAKGNIPPALSADVPGRRIISATEAPLTAARAAESVTPAVTPTATYLGEQEGLGPLFNIVGGPSSGSTVATETLQRMGIPVPKVPTATPSVLAAASDMPFETLYPAGKVLTPAQEAQEKGYRALQERLRAEGRGPTAPEPPSTPISQPEAVQAPSVPSPEIPTAPAPNPAAKLAEMLQPKPEVPPVTAAIPEQIPLGEPSLTEGGIKFYPSRTPEERVAGRGRHYDALKEILAEKAQKGTPEYSALRAAGGKLQAVRKEANMPSALDKSAVTPKSIAETPAIDATTLQGLEDTARLMQETGQTRPEVAQDAISLALRMKGEKGEISPELLARLGLATGGALIGGATDPLDNPMASAAAGAVGGFAAPSLYGMATRLAQRTAADPSIPSSVKSVVQALANGDEKQTLSTLWNQVPDYFRANLLISPNLPNNMWTGPWGAGMAAGLEHYMAGNPVGLAILQQMTPANWAKEFQTSLPEARKIILDSVAVAKERIEGFPQAQNLIANFLRGPAIGMLAGDIATRRILANAGLSEELARAYTLTSEPVIKELEALVNFQRSGPIGRLLLPFAKTLTNVVEQSAARTPVVGKWVQKRYPGLAYSPEIQAQQQILGAAVPTAAGSAGYLAPEEDTPGSTMLNRLLGSAVSNVAGPYSGLAGVGFGVGKALASGKDTGFGDVVGRVGSEALKTLPLPSTDVPQSYLGGLKDLLNMELNRVPAGMVPGGGTINVLLKDAGGRKDRPERKRKER